MPQSKSAVERQNGSSGKQLALNPKPKGRPRFGQFPCGCVSVNSVSGKRGTARLMILRDGRRVCPCGNIYVMAWLKVGVIPDALALSPRSKSGGKK
jgi:hypothetical protein